MSRLRDRWEDAAVDPDPVTDLGYEYTPLTSFSVDDDRTLFLPGEEDHLTDAEFIIVDDRDLSDLAAWR